MSNVKNQSNPSLKELLEKYKNSSVVSEIEKNIQISNAQQVNIDQLKLHPLFDENNYKLSNDLMESIQTNGILFPLFVVPKDDYFVVINGVKRFLSAKKLKFVKAPIAIVNIPEDEMIAYILQNEIANGDNAFVKGHAYYILKNKFNYSEKDIQSLTGLSHGQVNNLMRMRALPNEIKRAVVNEKLQYAQARVLLGLDKDQQLFFMDKIISDNLSVRESEALIRTYKKESFTQNLKNIYTRKNKTITITLDSSEKTDELEEIIKNFINNL